MMSQKASRPSVIYFVCFFLAISVLLAACSGNSPYKKVRLSAGSEGASANTFRPGKTPLRVAIAGVISPKETLRTYNTLLDYMGSKLGRPVELVQKPTYAEINELLRSGNVDVAFVCGLAYVEGNREFGMELLVAPEMQDGAVYYSYLIVPLDSAVQDLNDLRGKTFAFSDPLSNSGRLVPTYLLSQMDETPEHFFSKYVFTYSHDKSIKAVAEKLVDGAAVDSLVYDHSAARSPEYTSKTRVISRSGPYGSPPVVVHPEINGQLKQQIRDVFVGMEEDEAGSDILRDLMIDRFVILSDRAYDPIREMASKLR